MDGWYRILTFDSESECFSKLGLQVDIFFIWGFLNYILGLAKN